MAIVCPNCGVSLRPFNIRNHFKCPSCSVPLKGQIIGPIVITILLWQVADIFLYPFIHIFVGDTWPSFILRSLLSLSIGLPLYMLFIAKFSKVEVDEENQKQTTNTNK